MNSVAEILMPGSWRGSRLAVDNEQRGEANTKTPGTSNKRICSATERLSYRGNGEAASSLPDSEDVWREQKK